MEEVERCKELQGRRLGRWRGSAGKILDESCKLFGTKRDIAVIMGYNQLTEIIIVSAAGPVAWLAGAQGGGWVSGSGRSFAG